MGFMSQFKGSQPSNNQPNSNQLNSLFQQAQTFAAQNGGAQAVIDQLANNGAICTMPSGKQIAVKDIVTMSKTMTPQQLLVQLMQA